MDGQGFSIFQGVGSIQLNTSFQKAQEQEELEDKKRRDAEVNSALNTKTNNNKFFIWFIFRSVML